MEDTDETMEKLNLFYHANSDILSDITFEQVLEIFSIFRNCNPEYGICHVVIEDDVIAEQFNKFIEKHKLPWNKYINERWEQKH